MPQRNEQCIVHPPVGRSDNLYLEYLDTLYKKVGAVTNVTTIKNPAFDHAAIVSDLIELSKKYGKK